jgi:hypothetical protein
VSKPQGLVGPEGLGKLIKFHYLTRYGTHVLQLNFAGNKEPMVHDAVVSFHTRVLSKTRQNSVALSCLYKSLVKSIRSARERGKVLHELN